MSPPLTSVIDFARLMVRKSTGEIWGRLLDWRQRESLKGGDRGELDSGWRRRYPEPSLLLRTRVRWPTALQLGCLWPRRCCPAASSAHWPRSASSWPWAVSPAPPRTPDSVSFCRSPWQLPQENRYGYARDSSLLRIPHLPKPLAFLQPLRQVFG